MNFPVKIKTLVVGALVLVLVAAGVYLFFFKKEKETAPAKPTLEEMLESVTAPAPGEPVSKELFQSVTAPKSGKVSDDLIKSVTAP